ncbi:MAG: hypothetical protein KKC18_01280 [Chloroflexi bacterium]|nr:hypothetical protein [Chloroflexota bacterium]
MSTNANVHQPVEQTTPGHILSLLDDLPPESLNLVERFVQFLQEQVRLGKPVVVASEQEERPSYRYPTVPLPPSALDGLIGIMPPVGGNALADTESLYDEV